MCAGLLIFPHTFLKKEEKMNKIAHEIWCPICGSKYKKRGMTYCLICGTNFSLHVKKQYLTRTQLEKEISPPLQLELPFVKSIKYKCYYCNETDIKELVYGLNFKKEHSILCKFHYAFIFYAFLLKKYGRKKIKETAAYVYLMHKAKEWMYKKFNH
jgi:hypothetical protein